MRHADSRRLFHSGQFIQEQFYFPGIDIEPAGDDDILGAADDGYISVFVNQPLVAGVEKTVCGEILGGFFG
jgi:hypothetical protein